MRLLLVEDDRRLARVLCEGFSEEGYTVRHVASGAAARAALAGEPPDVCVLDVQLPDVDGFAVLAEARRAAVRVPIVLLTARDAVADRVHGLDQGADDYVTKPFAFAELLARLRLVLRRGTPHVSGVLRARDLELDPRRRVVQRDGVPIELTPKQFALLHYLLLHQGEVVSRQALLKHVFGYDFDPGTNLIDVHVGQLRRRIDRDGRDGASLIRSARGVGYVIPE